MPKMSDVWQHFTHVTDDHGKFVNQGECNYCRKVLKTKDGTSNMWKHLRKFHPQEAAAVIDVGSGAAPPPQHPPPCAPSPEAPGSIRKSVLQEAASEHLAQMIALRGFDPSLLEDDCFRSFVASINPEFRLPSRVDIENMCDDIFDQARQDVFSRLRHAPGRVSVAVGTVKLAVRDIQREVLYTACHFIDDEWNLHKVIMDAYVDGDFLNHYEPLLGVEQAPLSSGYENETIEKVVYALSKRHVLDNLFFMVWETKDLKVIHPDLRNQIEQSKYYANQTNRTELIISTTYMDSVIQSIAGLLMIDASMDDELTTELQCLDLMTRKNRQKILSQLGLDNLWAYDEHWYPSYCSLEVLRKEDHSPNTGSVFTELLRTLWREMYRSIQRISALSSPTSNLCLLELLNLREVLQWGLAQAMGDNANAYKISNRFLYSDEGHDVADVLGEAMEDLDGHIKDSYLVWSIPLILDPRYKLAYTEFIFKMAFVDSSEAAYYISRITEQMKELYADYIKYGDVTNSANPNLVTVTATGSSTDTLAEAWAERCHLGDSRSRSTDDNSCVQAEKELDRYLQDFLVPITESFDILKWWKENSWNYSTLARMARDALAMPTCSKISSNQIAHVRSILRGYSYV